MEELTLTAGAFEHNGTIPSRYTCDGDDISPALAIKGVPQEARSLVLIVDDPDVPKAVRDDQMFDHWVVFNIPPETTEIPEGVSQSSLPGMPGSNTAGGVTYYGPCPPPHLEPKEHRYIFQLYALDTMLDVREGANKDVVRNAMKGHILQKAELIGKYQRASSL